ncbi:hypothetical protein [Actinoplanes sp. L3-i22]|uniref:hypothetical protein n=1 Tax=Actinoplanes sp. L3-i22 TaxID=2836373 RepID=UPI001C859761|nr:hypothetical protein [Actinoplanes sp. L3-i22]
MTLAADTTSGGSNVTLIIAVIGVLGTRAGDLVTQWLTDRREERRWAREREQEAKRWERERQERKEQRQREDSARPITTANRSREGSG